MAVPLYSSRSQAQTTVLTASTDPPIKFRSPPSSALGSTLVPSEYRQDALDVLCDERAAGSTLKEIVKIEGMPPYRWFVRAFTRDAALFKRYRDALDLNFMLEADRLLEIADNVDGDVARAKLQIGVRQWLLERRDPRNFGEKTEVTHEIGSELKDLFENARQEGRLPPAVQKQSVIDVTPREVVDE